jgi:hypothetical protein
MPNPMGTVQTAMAPSMMGQSPMGMNSANMNLPLSTARPIEVTETTPNLEQIQNFPVAGRAADGTHFHQDPVSGQMYRMSAELHDRIPEILIYRINDLKTYKSYDINVNDVFSKINLPNIIFSGMTSELKKNPFNFNLYTTISGIDNSEIGYYELNQNNTPISFENNNGVNQNIFTNNSNISENVINNFSLFKPLVNAITNSLQNNIQVNKFLNLNSYQFSNDNLLYFIPINKFYNK